MMPCVSTRPPAATLTFALTLALALALALAFATSTWAQFHRARAAQNCDWKYYKVLGVKRDATREQIKKGYKKAALKYHPDVARSSSEPEVDFAEVNEAYKVLFDEKARKIYDKYCATGEEAEQIKRQESGGGNAHDFFSQMFGGVRHGGGDGDDESQRPRRSPVVIPLHITLAEMYNGKRLRVNVTRPRTCPHCHGSGAHDASSVHQCPVCSGRGVVIQERVVMGMMQFVTQVQSTCPQCAGKGNVIKQKCAACKGARVTRQAEEYVVNIPQGSRPGERIALEDAGDESPDYLAGEVVFELIEAASVMSSAPSADSVSRKAAGTKRKSPNAPTPIAEHARRDGDNLHVNVQLSLRESIFGFARDLLHLDGRTISLNRTRSLYTAPIQSGDTETVPGEGMPIRDPTSDRDELVEKFGDLIVHYTVRTPDLNKPHHANVLEALLLDIEEAADRKSTKKKKVSVSEP